MSADTPRSHEVRRPRAGRAAFVILAFLLLHPVSASMQGLLVPIPDCQCTGVTPDVLSEGESSGPDSPIWGYADLHSHQFSDVGFGGLLVWGDAFGLFGDTSSHLPWGDFSWKYPVQSPLGVPLLPWPFVGYAIHGPGGIGDLIGTFLGQGGFGHLVGGYPLFDGWPKWNDVTHQKEY